MTNKYVKTFENFNEENASLVTITKEELIDIFLDDNNEDSIVVSCKNDNDLVLLCIENNITTIDGYSGNSLDDINNINKPTLIYSAEDLSLDAIPLLFHIMKKYKIIFLTKYSIEDVSQTLRSRCLTYIVK